MLAKTIICSNCEEEIPVLLHDKKTNEVPCSHCGFRNSVPIETGPNRSRSLPGLGRLLLVTIISAIIAFGTVRLFLPEERLKVLFIGNSFTFGHDMPARFQTLVRTGKPRSATNITVVALPSFSLQEHWLATDTRALLCGEPWDYVILQDRSSMAFESPAQMESSISKIAQSLVEGKRRQVVLFSTWADLSRSNLEPAITSVYRQCAQKTRSALAPVGPAFIRAQRFFPGQVLFDPDGHHASEDGAWLSAMVIYSTMFGEKAVFPKGESSEKEKRLELIAGVAWETVQESGILCSRSFSQ